LEEDMLLERHMGLVLSDPAQLPTFNLKILGQVCVDPVP